MEGGLLSARASVVAYDSTLSCHASRCLERNVSNHKIMFMFEAFVLVRVMVSLSVTLFYPPNPAM